MIPKTIHLIWISRTGEDVPASCRPFVEAWKNLHLGWEVVVHDTETVTNQYPDLIPWLKTESIDLASLSNFLRYKLLYDHGGVYADIDTEPLKNFEPLLSQGAFILGRNKHSQNVCGNLILAEPALELCQAACQYYQPGMRSAPLLKYLQDRFPKTMTVLPYPLFQDTEITPQAYSIHWSHPLRSWVRG